MVPTAEVVVVAGAISFATTLGAVNANRTLFEDGFKEALVIAFAGENVEIAASDVAITSMDWLNDVEEPDVPPGSVIVSYSIAVPCASNCSAVGISSEAANAVTLDAAASGRFSVLSILSDTPSPGDVGPNPEPEPELGPEPQPESDRLVIESSTNTTASGFLLHSMLNEPGRNHLSYLVRFDVQLDASVQPSTRGGGTDTDAKDSFTIEVHPEWAPRGAARFAELVSLNFFDEARFFRVFRPAYPKPLLLLPANQPASAFKTSQLRQRVWAHMTHNACHCGWLLIHPRSRPCRRCAKLHGTIRATG
jgi:hypothetical protein